MKKLLFLLAVLFIATACPTELIDDTVEDATTDYQPIMMKREQLETAVEFQSERPLVNPGKIYFYQHYIFISERYKGVHIVNNADPANPQKTGFIQVPGSVDMAIKSDVLYMDSAVDLLAIDLSHFPEIEITKRIKDVFPDLLPPDANSMPEQYRESNREDGYLIVEWKKISNQSSR